VIAAFAAIEQNLNNAVTLISTLFSAVHEVIIYASFLLFCLRSFCIFWKLQYLETGALNSVNSVQQNASFLNCLTIISHLGVKKAPRSVLHYLKNRSRLGLSCLMTFPEYELGTSCNSQIVDSRTGNC